MFWRLLITARIYEVSLAIATGENYTFTRYFNRIQCIVSDGKINNF